MVAFRGQGLPGTEIPRDIDAAVKIKTQHHQRRAKATVLRWFALGIAGFLLVSLSAGCQQLRLPAIDPSGQCLLAPFPTSTTLALPGHAGESTLGSKIANHKARFQNHLDSFHRGVASPAFTEPVPPPPCVDPVGAGVLPPCGRELGATSPCGEECRMGPPAVLLGDECHRKLKDCLHLPERGTRGCILLSPQRIVAPVGGEVILLSGVCGTDGYLAVGEPLEWMLTPESVGTFIEVGDDAPGALHRLAKIEKTDKLSASFAKGVTSTKQALITRGNLNPNDDVPLDKGQTWLSISSPTEGTSRVTVLAPESDCWDQRKATATIYWIDSKWQFPGPQSVAAGTPVTLATRVTRAEGTVPARGWTVRYETLNPELGLFAPNGTSVVEAKVDSTGNAIAELLPVRAANGNWASGTAAVSMQVIRPGGESDNMPDLTLGSGQTFVSWSAPQLAIRAGAPAVATFNAPFDVVANLQNPGDQPATNVRVNVALPPGTRVTQSDSFAVATPGNVTWEIGTIPPRTQLDLFMTMVSQAPIRLQFQARGSDNLYAEDAVAIDVFRPSLSIQVRPTKTDATQVGEPVTFDIDVTNTGERALTGVGLRAVGDSGMTHKQTGSRVTGQNKTDGPLQPGQTWTSAATFIPLESGRRCVNFEAFADSGQKANADSCATVINRIVPVPAITANITGPDAMETGESRLFRYRIVNTGEVPLRNVRIAATFDPQLQLVRATEGADTSRSGQYQIVWTVPEMPPAPDRRSSVLLEGEFLANQVSPRSKMIVTVSSAEGARAEDAREFRITQGSPVAPPPTAGPVLPPIQPTPVVPLGPAPIPAVPRNSTPTLPPSAANTPPIANALSLSLLDRDDPVRVGQPIRYALSVRNTTNQLDSNVGLRFRLPPGVEVSRVTQRTAPAAGAYRREGDTIYLNDIRDLRPGESVDYDLELVSNQPQNLELTVEAISRLMPGGTTASQQTRVMQ